MTSRWSGSLAALLLFGCKALPEIPAGKCGNLVLEPPEDCDGYSRDGTPCRAPGTVGECRLDCTPDAEGKPVACPTGWGCHAGGICRPATGEFRAVSPDIAGNAESLLAGDFDGDGRDDVIGIEGSTAYGVSKVRVHYFDQDARLSKTWVSEKLMASPTITDLAGDGRADLAYTYGSVGVLVGESDRSLLPEAYPSYFLENSKARAVAVSDREIENSAAFAFLADRDGVEGIYVADEATAGLRLLAESEGAVEDLAADPVVGHLFEDDQRFPCFDVALAYFEASEVLVYSVCERDAETGVVHWREVPELSTVSLEPPTTVDRGPLLADMNGDGHLDLLVGTADGTYVALGDGESLDSARPYPILFHDPRSADPTAEDATRGAAPMPVAAGDLTGDGIADLVLPEELVLGQPTGDGRILYVDSHGKFGAPWSEARMADFNADGFVDLVCASAQGLDLDLFDGTGTERLNPFTVPTDHPVEHLTVGDFDGDRTNDLAFVQLGSSAEAEEEISIAFGRGAGPLEPPVRAARLSGVEQLVSFPGDPFTSISNMIVNFEQPGADGELGSALAFLVGSSDRSPPSPIELSTFAADGSLQTAQSFALTVGAFLEHDKLDVMPFGMIDDDMDQETDPVPGIWLLADIASRRSSPQSLGWGLDEHIASFGSPRNPRELSLRMSAGDLDGDGLDDLVFVSPDDSGTRCIVTTASVMGGSQPALALREAVVLDTACYESQLRLLDLDGDAAPELVLLAGELGVSRKILVLWNDGTGSFSAEDVTSAAPELEAPRAFTFVREAHEAWPLLAYVTDSQVKWIRSLGSARGFGAPDTLAEVTHGTGIVAADVDGDRIVDLVVADSGAVRVLHAELVP